MKKLRIIIWSFRFVWKVDKKTILLWFGLCAVVAVLPAAALNFNRETLSVLSGFLTGENYVFADVLRPIIALGSLMIAIGLSARVNADFIYMMMYDSYFVGLYLALMESAQWIEMKDLLKKDFIGEYNTSIDYAGSLIDFTTRACTILGKIISAAALLIVTFSVSKVIFSVSGVYVIGIFIFNFRMSGKDVYDHYAGFLHRKRTEYYERLPENRGMAKETRIYENTDEVVRQWEKPYFEKQKIEQRYNRSSVVRDFISGAGFYVFLIIVVGLNLGGVAGGKMSPDVFLVSFTICLNFYTAISGLGGDTYSFNRGLLTLERQRYIIEYAPKQDEKEDLLKSNEPADEDVIFSANNLSFSYQQGEMTLNNVSFSVKKGEIIALVGKNGSGKTTLVKLLLGIYEPDSGEITFMGRPHGDYQRGFLRKKIGVFFQDFFIFHQTLRENVAFGGIEDLGNEDKIKDAIRKGGAEKIVSNLPQGLDNFLVKKYEKTGAELSGGEKQRIGVSRAHMNNRDVLIFDEPASMLDPIAELEQFGNIKDMLEERTAILISHRVGFGRLADRIIMLDAGEIVEMGSHNELMAQNGHYAQFFLEQAQWYNKETASISGGTENERGIEA